VPASLKRSADADRHAVVAEREDAADGAVAGKQRRPCVVLVDRGPRHGATVEQRRWIPDHLCQQTECGALVDVCADLVDDRDDIFEQDAHAAFACHQHVADVEPDTGCGANGPSRESPADRP
jgi:hypothetical protein